MSNLKQRGFMLIEVLIALAIFGLSAVYLVDGAFIASRTIRVMKDTRELEQDLLWARSEIFRETEYEKMEEGGDLPTISMGEIRWETEIEMTEIIDLFKVRLLLEYDGNDELGVEPGERTYTMLMFRPKWGGHGDFSTDRNRLVEDKRDKIREIQDERNRN